jgi:peptidoglycan hydrolase CwlO-like protein
MQDHIQLQSKFSEVEPEIQKLQLKYDESLNLSVSLQKTIEQLEKQVKERDFTILER